MRKFASSAQIITRDKMKVNTRFVGIFNNLFDTSPDGVTQNNHGQESLVLFEGLHFFRAVNLTFHLMHQGFELSKSHVTVGEGQSSHRVDALTSSREGTSSSGFLQHFLHLSLDNVFLVLLAQRSLIGSFVANTFLGVGVLAFEVALAVLNNDLWGTLDVDSDGILQIGMFNSRNGPLQLRVKGYFSQNSTLLARHDFMHGDISILEPIDEGNFSAIANRDVEGVFGHLNVRLRVVDNALLDLVNDVLIKLAVHESVLARVLDVESLSEEAVDFHLLSRHRASLSHADVRKNTCVLNRAQITHKDVVVLTHLEDTVGQRNLNSHGQTFGD